MGNEWKSSLLKYLVPAYFIFNFTFLPSPLTWLNVGAMLTLFVWWQKSYNSLAFVGILIFVMYAIIHFMNGVHQEYYLRSSALVINLPITALAIRYFLLNFKKEFQKGIEWATWGSFILFFIGLLLYFTDYASILWKKHDFIGEGDTLLRYKGLTYEPSHYALVVTPLFAYYLIKYAIYKSKRDLLLLIACSIPIAATLSFGFAAAFFITIFLIAIPLIFMGGRLRKIMLWVFFLCVISGAIILSTENTISQRTELVMEGKDPSVNGRTTEAFMLGYQCAQRKSAIFGIGQGQVKVVGEEVIRPYYQQFGGYSKEGWPVLALPNSSAEALAMYGLLGLILKLGLEFLLFFRMRVYRNWFQLFLFIFIFFYQLMGSFFLSVAEIMMWILAFTPLFPEFNIHYKKEVKAVE